ncbi:MAG: nuclear transport factor 2 family protein [Candidatus Heimdallarchaeota archaeon]|nr:nuclear transport factor 2 family protein [Candidatus Heimdallarchaeota archaeon]
MSNEVLKEEILQLYQSNINAHLSGDHNFIADTMADKVISVSNGDIRYSSKEEIRENFKKYLGSTEFSTYMDVVDPIIEISDDGSMAYFIAQTKIVGKRKYGDETKKLDFTCAWMTILRRQDDTWKWQADCSTFK